MSINLKKLVIGSHLKFAREGTVISGTGGGTVSPLYKPTLETGISWPTEDPNWPSLGIVEEFTPTPKVESEDIMCPSPGAYRRVDSVVTSNTLDLEFVLKDVSELIFEMLMLSSGAITDSTAYTPTAGTGQLRGWLKCQQYNQSDSAVNVFDTYVGMTIKAQKMDNKLIKANVTAKVFYSSLSTGLLTLA